AITLQRRTFLLALGVAAVSGSAAAAPTYDLVSRSLATSRQTTRYLECGPADGPLMIFLHGWPSIGLMWRAQMEAFS
ncbi:alpha/beta fold hydrolase, partial [Paraburkholderia sp. SIMBA_027]|uniref:alpha/beta fold hydrolase n=1 Tax=Paraburkholderia sp. SIMBA_027 TaxID=3085770 RepID=UPI00397BFE48